MTQQLKQKKSFKPTIFSKSDDYKTCQYCGQGKFPFRYGVCICGKQVGDIQYVKNAKTFARNYYSFKIDEQHDSGVQETMDQIDEWTEKYDTAIEETFAGVDKI